MDRFRISRQKYPSQFWLLFWGLMISTIGSSMIWPFLMIYVSEKLRLPLIQIASLMTLNSIMGILFSFIAGPIADRLGRKGVMIISLAINGLGYLAMSQAHTFPAFAGLMALSGAANPLYRVGADAMMADLIPTPDRPEAYSLIRLSNNVGIAIGPAIGGFIATSSYTVAFILAATGLVAYSVLVAAFARETLPGRILTSERRKERFGGYGRVLRDKHFISFTLAFTLSLVCATMMWVLLPVYAKTNFNLPENRYGLIPTTNALMVVFLQLAVTGRTKRYHPFYMLALGSLFYALGVGSVALGRGFAGFWISMVVMTIGELILIPTATTHAANMAPADMRGRYMSIYGLAWNTAMMIGPLLGGFLNDHLGPVTIWYGAFLVGLAATTSFLVLSRAILKPRVVEEIVDGNPGYLERTSGNH